MGMVKRSLEEYCEAIHPNDFDAQDKLFDDIVSQAVPQPSVEEMIRVIEAHKAKQNADHQPNPDTTTL